MDQEKSHQPMQWNVNFGNSNESESERSILNPPQNYIDFRCVTHGMNGPELEMTQKKFFRDKAEVQRDVKDFFNWIIEQRDAMKLPVERIRRKYPGGREDSETKDMMIYDIQYWLEGGRIKQRKIYMPLTDKDLPGEEPKKESPPEDTVPL